ncbi:Protein phosphatase 2C 7 [Elasticomyces elasticus]|nr:Protein phosphatase 2C 7 [Elasticomyces elasticus]
MFSLAPSLVSHLPSNLLRTAKSCRTNHIACYNNLFLLPNALIASAFSRSFSSYESSARFSYAISASYSAKQARLDPKHNLYSLDPSNELPHHFNRKERPASGQDSFFASYIGSSAIGDHGDVAFGVVDGVGGWQDSGIDPADFAHGLCGYMTKAAVQWDEKSEGGLRPGKILDIGYQAVVQDKRISGGGSTASVATADRKGRMEVANLGDSGFLLLRPASISALSHPQTHAFNTPYQLSKIPQRMLAQQSIFGGSPVFSELPQQADISNHQLRHGDVIIFATDGVWDNLNASDTLRIVMNQMRDAGAWVQPSDASRSPEGKESHEVIVGNSLRNLTTIGGTERNSLAPTVQALLALAIVGEAKAASQDLRRDGPFAREVQRWYPGENYRGGKVDDICVVVAVVVEEGS